MQDTRTSSYLDSPIATGSDESTRLNWLLAENEREANRQLLSQDSLEDEEVLLMRHPIPMQKAFAIFGLLLGLLPPAAIFIKVFGQAFGSSWPMALADGLFILLLVMNTICCLVGGWMGSRMGRWLDAIGPSSWGWKFFEALAAGVAWGAVTGAAGGFPAYGFGAIAGAIYAIPVGMTAFPLFTLLHRLLARGGMIDSRHLWPLAYGVVMVITALILGM